MHFATIYAIYFVCIISTVLFMDGCIIYFISFFYPCCVELVLCSRQTLLVCTVSDINFFSHLEAQEMHNTLYFWNFLH